MAPIDAEMPTRHRLGEDLQQIAKHVASLRQELERLAGDVRRTGSHQIEHLEGTANAAAEGLAGAVRRNPLSALALAAGAGFLYGVLTRRSPRA
jgi:ElaB/YqjD/DUF883 family membrane-anchored ribosome-binding protein